MKKMILFLAAFLVMTSMLAQTSSVIVLELQGKAKFRPADGKAVKLKPGQVLPTKGELRMKTGTSMTLLQGVELVQVKEPGKYELADQLLKDPAKEQLGNAGDFFGMINQVFSNTRVAGAKGLGGDDDDPPPTGGNKGKGAGGDDDDPPPTGGNKGKGAGGDDGDDPPPTGGTKGKGAGGENPVAPSGNFNVKGQIPNSSKIYFPAPKASELNGKNWMLKVYQEGSDEMILEVDSDRAYHVVKLQEEKKISVGNNYVWETYIDGKEVEYDRGKFEVVKQTELDALLKDLKMEKEYTELSKNGQQLWEAYWLETNDYPYLANKKYRDLLEKDPDNKLVKRLYWAFWLRN